MNINSHGQINVPVLALLAVAGIITFLLITQSFDFKSPIFSRLYYKTPSQAFDGIHIPPQDENKTPTSNWSENWDASPYLSNWDQINFNCNVASENKSLILNCTNGSLVSKTSLRNDSSVIITGSLTAADNSSASVGISDTLTQLAKLATNTALENDLQIPNYQPGSSQNFRIVSSIVEGQRFMFYYLGDSPEPVKKGPISPSGDLNVTLSCQGLCTFAPLTISGVSLE